MRLLHLPLATRVAILYTLFGAVWIALSDRVAEALFKSPVDLTVAQTYKGWVFVLASGLLLLIYLARENKIRRDAQREFAQVFGQALEGIFQSTVDGRY